MSQLGFRWFSEPLKIEVNTFLLPPEYQDVDRGLESNRCRGVVNAFVSLAGSIDPANSIPLQWLCFANIKWLMQTIFNQFVWWMLMSWNSTWSPHTSRPAAGWWTAFTDPKSRAWPEHQSFKGWFYPLVVHWVLVAWFTRFLSACADVE